MLRVLVAEDSATARALLVAILRADPGVAVVGEAGDGVEAVALTKRLRPDVVTMDIHMPRLDGFEATRQIMIEAPTPIVIVSATIDRGGILASMDALQAGALLVLPKPFAPASPDFDEAASHLVAMVKAMAAVKVVRRWASAASRPEPIWTPPLPRIRVVAIAASTSGPGALRCFLGDLPEGFSVPILVVQHISRGFVDGLAEWLGTATRLRVKVATASGPLEPRTVYLAPDDAHLGLGGGSILLSRAPPIGGFRPSATFLFESVARELGPASLAVIMTGMGEDGVEGLRAVHRAGGRVLAQDEGSCVVFGMPGAAVAAGVTHAVLPLDALASGASRHVNAKLLLGRGES